MVFASLDWVLAEAANRNLRIILPIEVITYPFPSFPCLHGTFSHLCYGAQHTSAIFPCSLRSKMCVLRCMGGSTGLCLTVPSLNAPSHKRAGSCMYGCCLASWNTAENSMLPYDESKMCQLIKLSPVCRTTGCQLTGTSTGHQLPLARMTSTPTISAARCTSSTCTPSPTARTPSMAAFTRMTPPSSTGTSSMSLAGEWLTVVCFDPNLATCTTSLTEGYITIPTIQRSKESSGQSLA